MYELPEYVDLARVTETCKHPNQIPFLGICSSLPCFTAVGLVCLCAASLVPLLAIFSRSIVKHETESKCFHQNAM